MTISFKHHYKSDSLIGTGAIKFRHYTVATNFTLSDGSTLITSDGQIFNIKEI